MINRRKYWHTPPLDILSGGEPISKPSVTLQPTPKPSRYISLRDTIATNHFDSHRTPTTAALGIDIDGTPVYVDVALLPHMLIAGATGAGKSVAIHSIVGSMLYCAAPTQIKFAMIDIKRVELSAYRFLPHLCAPIATEPGDAVQLLSKIEREMGKRYKLMQRQGARDISDIGVHRIIIIIDELADLMLVSRRAVEPLIVRISQLGRAAGIHLIAATQKPLVSVVTGLIQGNIPCKLALQTASTSDSVRILGKKGAEQLNGKGDALLQLPDRTAQIRLQIAYTSDADIAAIVDYWRYAALRRKA